MSYIGLIHKQISIHGFDNDQTNVLVWFSYVDEEGDEVTVSELVPVRRLQARICELMGLKNIEGIQQIT